ncbi:FHA domain-containing protein [Sulfitobacter noctilucae]|uniref:DUF4123 domain-containing protein n=1 Tax=Sulfitobacter noctilucae TaxID=1342302 RepID=UPI000468CFB9|nr:DUF4123 domain-containing protein [Sulfitobacter noctilucae]KIN75113.1 FHA domain-containing protein [Sulfitobacter noctilucae]
MDLPEFISPPPEKEAVELALDALVFNPVAQDEAARTKAKDEETAPLKAYLLLDASINPDIAICVEAFSEKARCLFDGAAFEELSEVGPWLVELRRYGDAWDWFVEDGYGNNWGIVIHSRLPLMRLKTQMKKFIKIEDEDGETYFFKYYRPQHLNAYLPAFDAGQRASFMRGIESIYAETHGDSGTLQHYTSSPEGQIMVQQHDLIEVGMPLRIQPPSENAVATLLEQAAKDPADAAN